jgi:hypothetical protein
MKLDDNKYRLLRLLLSWPVASLPETTAGVKRGPISLGFTAKDMFSAFRESKQGKGAVVEFPCTVYDKKPLSVPAAAKSAVDDY